MISINYLPVPVSNGFSRIAHFEHYGILLELDSCENLNSLVKISLEKITYEF